ncbi:four-carbon acid sugar kinase family protein [Roseibium denhamense]|uniref:3-oxo-tetronate kinase n=1 Tax=Roseibium denhamense TaxID=76305 RepID=A0ABY1PLU0_9HYPH|nr:3-oxo-tetronate kinase [Roseibium denhamense]MTI05842.1 four-carbon acid sugar kinase family protein [Roseibium denhamense]SMP35466.1 Uncharacterized conserved protein YgbK, DUF1537 family [Roseibium denhamense]
MKLGVVADDFTGASDIALTLSEAGMPTKQFVGVPETTIADRSEAGVVSLKTRTVAVDDAVQQSLAACDWLLAQGCSQIVFKICSTFDSTDDGNIGPVTAALAKRLGERSVIVCPAFPENGRMVFQGHLFVGDRLLNESGMQNHPLTPMKDPDIRRVLARQTSWQIAHVPHQTVSRGAAAIASHIETASDRMVVIDAIDYGDLIAIGAAAKGRRLVTGGSGIALGLPQNFGFTPQSQEWAGAGGKAVVLSGSCSVATRGQVERYRQVAPSREIKIEDVVEKRLSLQELVEWTVKQDVAPLIYSSADPSSVKASQEAFGKEVSSEAIETLFANLAAALSNTGVERIVVAGGETSGAVVSGVAATTLEVGPRIAAGVPALKVGGRPLALALKSGNFGGPDFFEKALSVLETGA